MLDGVDAGGDFVCVRSHCGVTREVVFEGVDAALLVGGVGGGVELGGENVELVLGGDGAGLGGGLVCEGGLEELLDAGELGGGGVELAGGFVELAGEADPVLGGFAEVGLEGVGFLLDGAVGGDDGLEPGAEPLWGDEAAEAEERVRHVCVELDQVVVVRVVGRRIVAEGLEVAQVKLHGNKQLGERVERGLRGESGEVGGSFVGRRVGADGADKEGLPGGGEGELELGGVAGDGEAKAELVVEEAVVVGVWGEGCEDAGAGGGASASMVLARAGRGEDVGDNGAEVVDPGEAGPGALKHLSVGAAGEALGRVRVVRGGVLGGPGVAFVLEEDGAAEDVVVGGGGEGGAVGVADGGGGGLEGEGEVGLGARGGVGVVAGVVGADAEGEGPGRGVCSVGAEAAAEDEGVVGVIGAGLEGGGGDDDVGELGGGGGGGGVVEDGAFAGGGLGRVEGFLGKGGGEVRDGVERGEVDGVRAGRELPLGEVERGEVVKDGGVEGRERGGAWGGHGGGAAGVHGGRGGWK